MTQASDIPDRHAIWFAIGSTVMLVREMTPDPDERLELVRSLAGAMMAVVNDPKWGENAMRVRPARPVSRRRKGNA